MKVILSRKGFDSQYGGQPSPILQDGTLLSFPIPLPGESIKYDELFYNGKSFLEIIKELKPKAQKIQSNTTLHLDPDIRKDIYDKRPVNWKPIFGQCDAAQGALRNKNISINDLFLFFGWFKQTELINGTLQYKKGSPDLHIIFGFLQIGEIYTYDTPFPEYAKLHPHAAESYKNIKSNCIYVAREKLSFNESLDGAGALKYKSNLVLTRDGMSRSKWDLPAFFRDLNITYHNKDSFKKTYFQSRAKGQEFIIEENEELINWVKELIERN